MIFSGIDEAGLGPILGPFCGTLISIEAKEEPGLLVKDLQGKLFTVDDSKKVYKTKTGLKKIELNVLSFFYILNKKIPTNLKEFIPSLTEDWYKEDLPLPLSCTKEEIIETAQKIESELTNRNIKLVDIKRTAVSAKNFNILIDRFNNKSVAIQKIMDPLITAASIANSPASITIDKQGGRKFYKEYLEELTGNKIEIIKEENNCSIYSSGDKNIEFRAKADSTSFNVALASMFSKYMRELAMKSFNNYWSNKNPNIKSTAGYYTDGMRFIKELEESNMLPQNRDTLIRKK